MTARGQVAGRHDAQDGLARIGNEIDGPAWPLLLTPSPTNGQDVDLVRPPTPTSEASPRSGTEACSAEARPSADGPTINSTGRSAHDNT